MSITPKSLRSARINISIRTGGGASIKTTCNQTDPKQAVLAAVRELAMIATIGGFGDDASEAFEDSAKRTRQA